VLRKNNNSGVSVILILVFIVAVLSGAFYLTYKSIITTPELPPPDAPPGISMTPPASSVIPPTTTETPPPKIYPLIPDSGTAGTYNVSQGPHSGPTFRRVIFDPLDIKKDQELKITVILESNSGANSLTGVFQMDNSSTNVTFQRLSRQGTTETWEVKFTLTDSVDYKYILRLTSNDSGGTSTMGVAPRS
jgi:hypothetical protein